METYIFCNSHYKIEFMFKTFIIFHFDEIIMATDCISISQYHKRSSAANIPAPNEYEQVFIRKKMQVNTIR